MTDKLSLFLAQHQQEDSDLENYLTSVQEDMMEFKLSYEMWRVGCWAVSIPHVSYKYQWQCGMSWRLVICLLCKSLSSDGMLMLELEFWVGVHCVVGWLGGWEAGLHCSPGGEGQPWEPTVGHQEDLHGCYILLQQMAGKRPLDIEAQMLTERRFSGLLNRKNCCLLLSVCSALARGRALLWKQTMTFVSQVLNSTYVHHKI